jgi:membrane protein implicated in regulation of membrane protease activity
VKNVALNLTQTSEMCNVQLVVELGIQVLAVNLVDNLLRGREKKKKEENREINKGLEQEMLVMMMICHMINKIHIF